MISPARAPDPKARALASPLLEISNLSVAFETSAGPLRAVESVSLAIARGRTVGLVGESGSGKTVTASTILRLLDGPRVQVSGRVEFEGRDLLALPERELRALRGDRIAMVFQDPMSSLNPAQPVGAQVVEPLRIHRQLSRPQLARRAIELLAKVGVPAPEERVRAYPHELSGGLRQRVMLAMALACEPALLIADEPTTALDVTIQAQLVDLLLSLQRGQGLGILLITHDLGLVAQACDEVVVLYAGRVMEHGSAAEVLTAPAHPYTAGLLASTPIPGAGASRLREIPGVVPDLRRLPPGCRFQERCPHVQGRCRTEEPTLIDSGTGCQVRCHFPLPGAGR